MHTPKHYHFTSIQPQLYCLGKGLLTDFPMPKSGCCCPGRLPWFSPTSHSLLSSVLKLFVPKPLMGETLVQKSHIVFSIGLWRIPLSLFVLHPWYMCDSCPLDSPVCGQKCNHISIMPRIHWLLCPHL